MPAPEHFRLRHVARLLGVAFFMVSGTGLLSAPLFWIETPHYRIKWRSRGDLPPYVAAFGRKELPAPAPRLGRLEIYEALARRILRDDRRLAHEVMASSAEGASHLPGLLSASFQAWERVRSSAKRPEGASPNGPDLDRALAGALGHRAALVATFLPRKGLALLERIRNRLDDAPLRSDLDGALALARAGGGLEKARVLCPAQLGLWESLAKRPEKTGH